MKDSNRKAMFAQENKYMKSVTCHLIESLDSFTDDNGRGLTKTQLKELNSVSDKLFNLNQKYVRLVKDDENCKTG